MCNIYVINSVCILKIFHCVSGQMDVYCLQFNVRLGTRESIRRKVSWRTDYPLVLAACHKLDQGDRVRSLHELNKSANVGEG
jgi:hypothetical protein